MFEFLFKYPLTQYRQAEWFFASGWSLSSLLSTLLLVSLLLALSISLRRLSTPRKLLVASLQILASAVVLLMLWQPALRSSVMAPGENAVAVLLDTSRSMHYRGAQGSRLEQVSQALQQTQLLEQLAADFKLDLLSVSDQIDTLDPDSLPAAGSTSRLKTALGKTLNSGTHSVLSGVVLLSDGADTSNEDAAWWQRLTGAGVPVFTVGVGRETLAEDIALQSIVMRDRVTPDTRVTARITVRHAQAGSVRLRVSDGSALVYAADLELPAGVAESSHAIVFNSGEEGIRDLSFALEARDGEINLDNNSQRRILSVEDSRKRILYVEGEPRWEYKFIRRAVSESSELEIVSLLQTSPNKFYRQGVRDATELETGFPQDEQTLFAYDAVIIGSFEAAKLSTRQQQHLRDFVRVRGGALLMIAGPHGLSEGGWARTAVAQALPVALNDSSSYTRQRARAELTALGQETDWLRFAADRQSNRLLWGELPELADVQHPGRLKAGASALLEATVNDLRLPLLVAQRYGRGKSFILATSGTWRWQMSLPAQDQRHEQFWQGLLGELVAGALNRLAVSIDRKVYYDETRVKLTVDVRDRQYQPDLAARLSVQLREAQASPGQPDSEHTEEIQVLPTATPGRYQATVVVPDEGEYALQVANPGDSTQADVVQWFLREDQRVEDFALARDSEFLQRLATDTGGRYLDLSELEQLPGLLRQSQALLVKDDILPLWNMPMAFFLLFLFKLAEWLLRLRWNRI